MTRPFNFSAGPATLPQEVLQQAAAEMLDWRGCGMGVMEMSHRGKEFISIAEQAEADLRSLLAIPANFKVLFMQGGAIAENAILPMNLSRGGRADYVVTGSWSQKSAKEARKYCDVHVAASNEADQHTRLPSPSSWQLSDNAAYVHVCSNETIHGVEMHTLPDLAALGSPQAVFDASPRALAALLGAGLLTMFSGMESLFEYELGSQTREITPVKLMIGLLITGFVALELSPRFARLALPPSWIPLGGLLSGFFGGLSGNQGALRSAFLIKAGLSKEAFVGTSAVCAVMVDAVRLSIYWAAFHASGWKVLQGDEGNLVLAASLSAFIGAYFGKKLLKKVTLRTVELSVAGMMGLIGIALLTGLL